jgi:pyruvate,water dikinase
MDALKSYAGITDSERAPDAVFARGAVNAERAIRRLSEELKQTRHGRLKAAWARWCARRVRALAGLRETPKFTIIRLLGFAREALLESGRELAAQGVIDAPADIFFLRLAELRRLAEQPSGQISAGLAAETRSLIAERQRLDEREARRRQVPRVLLSDGRAFYAGLGQAASAGAGSSEDRLTGSPVSPGTAEGRVNVVMNPAAARMEPGDVLVCRGTDPSWTPLFLPASALVMEVGGLMTHGSVVAREYGIPAVVGVHNATTRLHSGQRVRVDGSNGVVTILDDEERLPST